MSETPDDAVAQPETLVMAIDPPINFKGGKYDTLSLREPKSGEVRKAEGQMRNNLSNEGLRLYNQHLIAMVSGWPLPVVELLPVSKQNEASRYLAGFTNAGQETGST